MAKQAINVGFVANDNTGDFLRPAMIKINENFSELYDLLATLQDIAFTGEYDDLNNPPLIPEFDGSYNSLDNLPTLGTASAEDIEFFAVTARGLPSGGTTGQILSKVSGTDYDVEWVDNLGGGGGSGIEALVEDTSPQLGGNLDLNSFVITGMEIGTNIQAYSSILDATTASFTTDLEGKLSDLPTLTELNALLLLKADLEDPIFTGIPTAPTASASDDSTQLATTAFVQDVVDIRGVPLGGTAGYALVKASGTDYDVTWDAITDPTGAEIVTAIGLEFVDDGALTVTDNIISVEEVLSASGASDRFMSLNGLGDYVELTYPESREILYPNTSLIYQDLGKVTVTVELFAEGETIVTGDGAARWPIPALYDGWTVGAVEAKNVTAGSGGSALNIQLWNTNISANILSTPLTIDLTETWSGDATTPAVINTSNNTLQAGTWIRFDVDAVPSTPPDYLAVTVTLYPPVA